MKHVKWALLLIVLVFLCTSCSLGGNSALFAGKSDTDIADGTFKQLVDAINSHDSLKVEAIFSKNAQAETDIAKEAEALFAFVSGDILSYTLASDAGVGVDRKVEKGKQQKEIQSSFTLKTTDSEYHVAVKECVGDDFDENNLGVRSVYIIESKDWNEDYIYRGDSAWTYGINLIDNTQEHA